MIHTVPITGYSLSVSPGGWPFAIENRARIDAHWLQIKATHATLWNGQILICTEAGVSDGHCSARLVQTDYASFVAWRDWGRPDGAIRNCFGVPVAFSSDGALLMGVMAGWTLNAGKSYPPSGTLEPKDVREDGTVNLLGNMRTELFEETGLHLDEGWAGEMIAIFDGPRLAIAQRHDFPYSYAEIEDRFARHKASDPQPELDHIEPVTSASQIDSRMPPYAAEIIRYFVRA